MGIDTPSQLCIDYYTWILINMFKSILELVTWNYNYLQVIIVNHLKT